MDENEVIEDPRRFNIFFQINQHPPVKVSDLKIRDYLQLKRNDHHAYQYCEVYTDEGEVIKTLFRSLDDVDYQPVQIPGGDKITSKDSDVATDVNDPNLTVSKLVEQDQSCSSQKHNKQLELRHPTSRKFKSSSIWDHVETVGNKKEKIRCTHCKKEFKNCGNTTNMRKHLSTQHPLLYSSQKENCLQETQETKESYTVKRKCTEPTQRMSGIVQAFDRVNSYKAGGYADDRITNAVMFMICKDMLSLSTVEKEGFLTLMHTTVPLYQVPSRATITRKIENKYELLKGVIIEDLQKIENFCLTCDNWTDCSTQSYLGITIHHLDRVSYKFKNVCLGCISVNVQHTAENLKEELTEVLDDFNIPVQKIIAVVTDGESAIKKATKELFGKERHIVCVAHVLAHLIPDAIGHNANQGLPELAAIINQVKVIVAQIRRSVRASDKLKQLQLNDGKSEGTILMLIQDVPTRWTTKIDMIERYLELDSFIYLALNECKKPLNVPTRDETKILKDVLPILKVIRSVIKDISGSDYPTCSLIIPIINCMEKKIDSISPETEVGKQFKKSIKHQMKQRFVNFELSPILAVATILDPRFKKIHFTQHEASYQATRLVHNEMELMKASLTENTQKQLVPSNSKDGSIWEFHDRLDIRESSLQDISHNSISIELNQYLRLERIERKENIFKYWINAQTTFPALSQIAIKKLSVLGTSVPSERLFSKAGLIKSDLRNRLTGGKRREL